MPAKKDANKRQHSLRSLWGKLHDSPAYKLLNDVSLIVFVLTAVGAFWSGVKEAAMHKPPIEVLLYSAVPFAVLAVFLGIWNLRTKAKRIFGLCLVLLFALIVVTVWWQSGVRVYPPFAEVAQKYQSELGNPLSPPLFTQRAAEQDYDNDIHIWMGRDQESWFLLPDGTFTTYLWGTYCDRPGIYDFSELVKMFPEVPAGKLPPYAGPACDLLNNPSAWRGLLEWMDWQCLYNDRSIAEQRFANGMIIGVVHTAPSVTTKGTIFVVFNDGPWRGTWRPEQMDFSPPPCKASMKESEQ